MVFIACGMGGGTGSGAAPVVARTAKEIGCLTVAVVTKPFFFEGQQRMRIAEVAIEELKQAVDALIVIPNDRLLQTIAKDITAKNAFAVCDNILREAVEGISDLITTPGIINIDFADIRSVMENAGAALMGIGSASGDNRAVEAAKAAISSPLLDTSINGAKGVLFSIAGGDDVTMFEIQDAAKVITESVDPNAKIIFGTVRDDKLKKGELKITVIASNFPDSHINKKATSLFQTFGADEEHPSKGKIFNTIPHSQPHKEVPNQKLPVDEKKIETKQGTPPIEDNDDDWSAVPSFLRRSKLK
jgi:cell division protein FtsZ